MTTLSAEAGAGLRLLVRVAGGPAGWLRRNLFDSPSNAVLTVLIVAVLVDVVPRVVGWAVTDAVWGAVEAAACKEAAGACWAMIHEKYRLILFGRYPFDQQWRPLLAILVLVGLLGLSCQRNFWRPWLAAVWAGGLVLFGLLMWGGLFGMTFVENDLWGGLPLTLLLAVVAIAVGFPISILLALGRRSDLPAVRALCIVYIELIRGVPLISLLFMGSFVFPLFMPTGVNLDQVLRAQVAMTMFSAAYLAEAVRGGLQAIPKGQFEAAEALGLGYWRTMWTVVLPQAIRIAIPPIVNTFIGLFKDTSLVAIVGLSDLLLATRQAIADPMWRLYYIEAYLFIAAIYFAFCFFMSRYSQYLEVELATGRKHA